MSSSKGPRTKLGYDNPQSHRVYVSKDVTFHEKQFFFTSPLLQRESSLEAEILELSYFSLLQDSTPTEDDKDPKPASSPVQHKEDRRFGNQYQRRKKLDLVQQLQSSELEVKTHTLEDTLDAYCESNLDDLPFSLRKRKRSYAKYLISQFVSTKNLFLQHLSFISTIDSIKIPTSVQEALKDDNWVRAMNEEMGALERNETQEIVERPKDKKEVGYRWIYTVKYQADGTLDRYKARFIAKEYTQTYWIDYEQTFAPVAKMNTVKIIISLAAHFGWEMLQFDVKMHSYMEAWKKKYT